MGMNIPDLRLLLLATRVSGHSRRTKAGKTVHVEAYTRGTGGSADVIRDRVRQTAQRRQGPPKEPKPRAPDPKWLPYTPWLSVEAQRPGATIAKRPTEKRATRKPAKRVGNGDCFTAAYEAAGGDLARFSPGGDDPDVRIVHGMPVLQGGEHKGERFWHAWVEVPDKGRRGQILVIDKSNGLDVEMPREIYYAMGRIDEDHVYRYTMAEHRRGMIENRHYGPWTPGWETMALSAQAMEK